MLLVLSKHIFIEKEGAWLFVTMKKRSGTMTGLMQYIKFLYRYQGIENNVLRWPLQMLITWKQGIVNPNFFI